MLSSGDGGSDTRLVVSRRLSVASIFEKRVRGEDDSPVGRMWED